ncbi:MAG TPA: MFS transporter, partial [Thermoanaerobaculia bacterium]
MIAVVAVDLVQRVGERLARGAAVGDQSAVDVEENQPPAHEVRQCRLPPPMRKASLAVLFLTVFIDLIGFGMVIPFLSFYAHEYGASGVVVGAVVGVYSIMQFFFAPLWGRLSDRIGRRPVLLVSLAASCTGYLLFGLARSLILLFASRVIAGVGGANIGTAQAYITDATSAEDRAKGMGLIG